MSGHLCSKRRHPTLYPHMFRSIRKSRKRSPGEKVREISRNLGEITCDLASFSREMPPNIAEISCNSHELLARNQRVVQR